MAGKSRKLDSSVFRRRISWAIFSPNLIGMPLISVIVVQILNMPLTNLLDSFHRSPTFFTYGFGNFALVAAGLALAHYALCIRNLRPIFKYLKNRDAPEFNLKEGSAKVALCALKAPNYTMHLSMAFYLFGVLLLIGLLYPVFRLTLGQFVSIFFVNLGIGGVISFFQSFTTRSVLTGLNEQILERFPDLVEDEELNKARSKYRNKIMSPMVTLCVSLVVLTGSLSYSNAIRSLQMHNGQLYVDRFNLQGTGLAVPQSFQLYATTLRVDYEDFIILTDPQGNVVSGEVPPDLDRLWKTCLLFEDDDLLVVNKPAGLNTHAPSPHAGEGLYDWLRHRERRWEKLAIIHRLDKETSGVIVFSKTQATPGPLTEQFTRRTVRKKYILLTDRHISQKELELKNRSHLHRESSTPAAREAQVLGRPKRTFVASMQAMSPSSPSCRALAPTPIYPAAIA